MSTPEKSGTTGSGGAQSGGTKKADGAPSGLQDLSYRNYDGPLNTRTLRWWGVSLAVLRTNLRKPTYWILAALISIWFLLMGLIFYLSHNLQQQMMGGGGRILSYPAAAFQAVTGSWLSVLLVALTVGSGSIAADNQANALLVYLSKPVTKTDYLLGKWVGVFILVAAVLVVPCLVLYLFFLTAYYDEGFLKEQRWLLPRLLGLALLWPMVHTSMVIGISAWTKSARVAGAIYAGIYFLSVALNLTASSITIPGDMRGNDGPRQGRRRRGRPAPTPTPAPTPSPVDFGFPGMASPEPEKPKGPSYATLKLGATLARFSVDGVAVGLGYHVMGIEPSDVQAIDSGFYSRQRLPYPVPLALLLAGCVVLPVLAARFKIRAVEVISG